MHAINGLILNRRCPPTVCQDDNVGSHQVEPNAADREAGEHDCAAGIGLQGGHGGIPGWGAHGAVDAGVGIVVSGELSGDDVEEGGPLAEDDDSGAWFAVRGFEDAEEGFGFAAACVDVEVLLVGGGFAEAGSWADKGVSFEGFSAAEGTSVLGFDDALDTFVAEDMGAGRDDGIVKVFEADRTFFAGIDTEL